MSGVGRRTLGRRALALGALGLIASLPGCASPEPEYYRLTPVPGTRRAAGGGTVKLRQVGLPGYLDRPEIVRSGAGGRLDVLGGARWAEPLDGMLERVLAENLGQRLPGVTAFGAGSTLSADADRTLEVELQRFEADATGTVELVAQVGLLVGRGASDPPRRLRATAPVAGENAAALAAAMSEALGRLCDQLAGLLSPGASPRRRGSAPPA